MRQVTVIVKPDGTIMIDAEGFVGPECRIVTDALTEALGEKKTEILKPEYYLPLSRIQDSQIRRQ